MSDNKDTPSTRSRDIDISKPGRPRAKTGWLWLFILLLLSTFLYLTERQFDGIPLLIVGLVIFAVVAWVAWILIVRHVLTWGRLASAPARALARGDKAEAERALSVALERARRFAPDDHRRGLMAVSELSIQAFLAVIVLV